MSKPRSDPISHILRNIPNKAARDDSTDTKRNTSYPHPLQALRIRPSTAHLRTMDNRLVDPGERSDVLGRTEPSADESLSLGGRETGCDGVLADVEGEAGGEFVDEDVVVDCVADGAAYGADAEGEGDAGGDCCVRGDCDGDCGGWDEHAADTEACYCAETNGCARSVGGDAGESASESGWGGVSMVVLNGEGRMAYSL